MDSSVTAYKDAFLQAANENVAIMLSATKQLQIQSNDTQAVEDLFIKSHSLKGQSMTMGFSGIAKAALVIERYMRLIRDGEKVIDSSILPAILLAIEDIQKSLVSIEKNNKETALSATITKLEQITGVSVNT